MLQPVAGRPPRHGRVHLLLDAPVDPEIPAPEARRVVDPVLGVLIGILVRNRLVPHMNTHRVGHRVDRVEAQLRRHPELGARVDVVDLRNRSPVVVDRPEAHLAPCVQTHGERRLLQPALHDAGHHGLAGVEERVPVRVVEVTGLVVAGLLGRGVLVERPEYVAHLVDEDLRETDILTIAARGV